MRFIHNKDVLFLLFTPLALHAMDDHTPEIYNIDIHLTEGVTTRKATASFICNHKGQYVVLGENYPTNREAVSGSTSITCASVQYTISNVTPWAVTVQYELCYEEWKPNLFSSELCTFKIQNTITLPMQSTYTQPVCDDNDHAQPATLAIAAYKEPISIALLDDSQ